MFVEELAGEHGMIFPRFVAIDAFFLFVFLLFYHYEYKPTFLTLLFLLKVLLPGVRRQS